MSTVLADAAEALHRLVEDALEGVQVAFGVPTDYEEQEVVSLMGVRDASEDEAQLGAANKWETFALEVGVKVHKPDGDARAVFLRTCEIYDSIRDVVHGRERDDDRTLDGALGNGWATIASRDTDVLAPAKEGGWIMFQRVLVVCRARVA